MDQPTQPAEPTAEAKQSRGFSRFFVWPTVILVLYVLSLGPVRFMGVRGMYPLSTKRVMNHIYAPLTWAYNNTLLHRPLGMYLHLWCPEIYERNGESFEIVGPTKYDHIENSR